MAAGEAVCDEAGGGERTRTRATGVLANGLRRSWEVGLLPEGLRRSLAICLLPGGMRRSLDGPAAGELLTAAAAKVAPGGVG